MSFQVRPQQDPSFKSVSQDSVNSEINLGHSCHLRAAPVISDTHTPRSNEGRGGQQELRPEVTQGAAAAICQLEVRGFLQRELNLNSLELWESSHWSSCGLRVGYKPSVHLAPAGNHERKPWSEKPLPEASHMAKPVVQRAFPARVLPGQARADHQGSGSLSHSVTVSHLTPERVLDVPSCHCPLIQSRVISRPSWDHI